MVVVVVVSVVLKLYTEIFMVESRSRVKKNSVAILGLRYDLTST